jgi:hypothetical protein
MSDDSAEREQAAVRALDLVRPEKSPLWTEIDQIHQDDLQQQRAKYAQRQLGQQAAAPNPYLQQANVCNQGQVAQVGQQKVYCVGCDRYHGGPRCTLGFVASFHTATAPIPGEIYCLADLASGEREPTNDLKRRMSSALYEHAHAVSLKGNFTERTGTQYKIATDVVQYYIVRRYGDELKI